MASERLLNDNSLVHALFVGRTSGGGGAADLVAQLIVRPESGATATDATKKLLAKAAALVRQGTTIKLEKNSDNNYNIYVRIHNVDPYTYFFFGFVGKEFGAHHLPATFLDDLQSQFLQGVGSQVRAQNAYSMQKQATVALEAIAARYRGSKLMDAQQKTAVLSDQMKKNIDLALANQEKIEGLEEKSESLHESAKLFEKKSSEVKRHFCIQYWKVTLLIALVVCAIITVVVVLATR